MQVLPQAFDLNSPAWLISLRWIAILMISATIAGAHLLFQVDVNWTWIVSLLVWLAVWNLALPWLEEFYSLAVKSYVFVQIVIDLVVLTCILWLTGGLANPFASFYVLHVLIAGLLLSPRRTIATAGLAILFLVALMAAPPLHVAGEALDLRDSPLWIGLLVALVLLIVTSTAFILAYMARLARGQSESRQREKMAAMGRLVAGLAHELGTPLNVILLLAKDLADGATESARRDLDTIASQAKRCGDLVALLLGYSRSAHGMAPVVVDPVAWLGEIFRSALASLEDPKYKTTEFTVANNLAVAVVALPELALRQVLWNLLRNAIQAAGVAPYPKVTVEINPVEGTDQIQFLIKDNGPGFSAESRDRAFEAFYSTKKPGEGDGLGLYMSYHLMEQLSGKIAIPETAPGGGGLVEVTVPQRRGEA